MDDDRKLQAFAAGAAGGGLARLRLLRINCALAVKAPRLSRVEFEGAAALGTDVIETTLRLAGVNDVCAPALRAANNVFECGEGHVQVF